MGLRAQRHCHGDGVQGARPNHFPCGELGGHQPVAQWPVRWRGGRAAAEQALLRQQDLGTPPMTSATQTPKLGPERPTQAHWLRPSPSGWVRGPLECVLPGILAGRPSLPGPSESGPCSPTTGSLGLPAPPPASGLLPNSQPGSVGGGGALRQWGAGLTPSTQRVLAQRAPPLPLPQPHAIHPSTRPRDPRAAATFPNLSTRRPSSFSVQVRGPFLEIPGDGRWAPAEHSSHSLQSHLCGRELLPRPPLALSAA